jgi:hypothetical protein
MSEGQVYTSKYAKYYHEVVKSNPERLDKERERIRVICKDKYDNNEEYKQKKREQALANYYKRKERANIPVVV